jgi:hypothetical protein
MPRRSAAAAVESQVMSSDMTMDSSYLS